MTRAVRFQNPDDDEVRELLSKARTVAVLGLSPHGNRASHMIAAFLIEAGYDVVGVRPGYREILGRPCFPTLADVPFAVDLVDIFRRSEFVAKHIDECLAVGVPAIWLQLGVVDEVAAGKAREAGIQVVMDRCIMVEHRRLQVN